MSYVPPRRSDGTLQRRREKLPWPEDRPFRILSIDGGGICGILPAAILAELEKRFLSGSSVADYFDMIAGTSTGGIIALALAHGLTAQSVLEFYVERGSRVFPRSRYLGGVRTLLRRILRAGYDETVLREELLRIFGDTAFGDACVRLCIPSFDGVHGEPWIYKTPHHPDYRKDRTERMVNVALATSAAPTFFRAIANSGCLMVDGGLWANNPTMNAVVDALACFDVRREQIEVLSLGCGETSFSVNKARANGGLFRWRDAIKAAMKAQSSNALGQAYLLLGKQNVTRLDAPESDKPVALDDHVRAARELPLMARSLVEGSGRGIEETFLRERATPFRPVATDS